MTRFKLVDTIDSARVNVYKVDNKEVEKFPVDLYNHIAQNGIRQPTLMRFSLSMRWPVRPQDITNL